MSEFFDWMIYNIQHDVIEGTVSNLTEVHVDEKCRWETASYDSLAESVSLEGGGSSNVSIGKLVL